MYHMGQDDRNHSVQRHYSPSRVIHLRWFNITVVIMSKIERIVHVGEGGWRSRGGSGIGRAIGGTERAIGAINGMQIERNCHGRKRTIGKVSGMEGWL